MKLCQQVLTSAIALTAFATSAWADVTVYITGATAYRSPASTEIESLLDLGCGVVYGNKSGVTSEKNATHAAFRGTSSNAALSGLGTITVKVAWGGSVGGLKMIAAGSTFNINDQPGVLGWIPDSQIPAVGAPGTPNIVAVAETGIVFESGASAAKPDAAFSDAFQSSAGVSGLVGLGGNSEGRIAAIMFDLVAMNGVDPTKVTKHTGVTYGSGTSTITVTSPAPAVGAFIGGQGIKRGTTVNIVNGTSVTISNPTTAANNTENTVTTVDPSGIATCPITNVTSNAFNTLVQFGASLALFTGNPADSATKVYLYGRNADSGTRISELGESGRGIALQPGKHVQPTIQGGGAGGTGGKPYNRVTALANWPLETILGKTYTPGQGGYTSGGALADALTTPGALTATGLPGWVIGYLGRSDSNTAMANTFGYNTAKRLQLDGQQDWIGLGDDVLATGAPTGGFNDTVIKEGAYHAWEFEHFYRSAGASANAVTFLNQLATNILAVGAAPTGSILFGDLKVSRTVEGGPIQHN